MARRRRFVYAAMSDGQWVTVPRRGWRLACCDCGLVHLVNFRIVGGRLQVQAVRHARATAGRRQVPHVCRCDRT
jgi:hypothetical protein